MKNRNGMIRYAMIGVALVLAGAGCDEEELIVPTEAEIEAYYQNQPNISAVDLAGNVVQVTVIQAASQLRQGGSLWARVGPYIYLFSEPTQSLMTDFPGVGGVRVTTQTSGGTRVASVLLRRDALNDLTWRRALNLSGLARRDGAEQMTLLADLVRWGEDRTEHEYSSRWVGG